MPPTFELRQQQEDDAAFVQMLVRQHKYDSLTQAGLPPPVIESLLPMQVKAHLAGIIGNRQDIILSNGIAVGRMVTERQANTLHLMELLLSPEHRSNGLGTALILHLQDYARQERINISLNVDALNPARALYNRLGFREGQTQRILIPMEWGHDNNNCKN